MSSHAEESSYYSDEILAGIVEFLRLCKEIRSRIGSGRRFIRNNCQFNDWKLDGDTVESVDVALYEKYQDSEFIAGVWAAIRYEKPVVLTLHDTSGESEAHATIYTRTQAQQRLSIYIYAVLFCMDNGMFDTGPGSNAAVPSLPSLKMLQHLKVDTDNEIMCTSIGAIVGLDRAITSTEIEDFVPASSIFFLGARPLAEVMLPLDEEDQFEMMSKNGTIPQRFQADHAALLYKIDAHFLASGCSEYYTMESGPPMVANSYDDAMRVIPFKHAFCVPMQEHCGNFHYFWRRVFNYCTCVAACKTVLHDGKWGSDRRNLLR